MDPGEVAFLLSSEPIPSQSQSVLLRLSYYADNPNAQLALMALDQKLDGSITYRISADSSSQSGVNTVKYNYRLTTPPIAVKLR